MAPASAPLAPPAGRPPAAAPLSSARAGGPGLEEAGLELACLGGALPPAVAHELVAAGAAWHDDAVAEAHLARAFDAVPDHAAVHIALYRFYFYKNRLRDALEVAWRCLAKAARDNRLAADWRVVRAADADFASWGVLPRFYLFTLKGCAYLSLRVGDIEQGEALIAKLLELDPLDRLGGSVLRGVLARRGLDDED